MEIHELLILILVTLIAVATAGHALLYKRDPRSAFAWVAICLLFPVAGPVLYAFFGVNRIKTRARKLQQERSFHLKLGADRASVLDTFKTSYRTLPEDYLYIGRIADAVTGRTLISGNTVTPLINGDAAYPDMLASIAAARHYIFVSTYIFQTDQTGLRFVEALAAAAKRGVEVRIIVDGIGELYGLPRLVSRLLKSRHVRVARFLPPTLLPPTVYINLRNHRKLLIVDGRTAHTGGMNISDRHLADQPPPPPRASDVHFRIEGPVIIQLEHAFLEHWYFCTGEDSLPEVVHDWSAQRAEEPGSAVCRAIVEGPNEELNVLSVVLVGAISSARQRVLIVTPYFLPSREMIGALQSASLRGVDVSVILPEKNNLPYIKWATQNMLWEMVEYGVQVYYQPPPFAHTKIFIVDDIYAQIGSANMDPRSLRLNFELNVEVFDRAVVSRLADHISEIRSRSRQVALEELDSRPLPVRTRDALAWLFSPYL